MHCIDVNLYSGPHDVLSHAIWSLESRVWSLESGVCSVQCAVRNLQVSFISTSYDYPIRYQRGLDLMIETTPS